ncbi:hypothetical protein B0H19DRAFT_1274793 [Mycena capillaripes]|nr:hypothetical protein B0H19DRAFT_1274793 [Mycena capillaripes]
MLVCILTCDMLRRLPPVAPPRLRRYNPFHTRRIRSAHIAFTAVDPANSPPLFITALALRIQRRVASIVYVRMSTFLIGISKTYAPHQQCTPPAFAGRKLRSPVASVLASKPAVPIPPAGLQVPIRHRPVLAPSPPSLFNASTVASPPTTDRLRSFDSCSEVAVLPLTTLYFPATDPPSVSSPLNGTLV